MDLYTERYGLRSPKKYSHEINAGLYSLLFRCCRKYRKNLTHLFPLESHHDFTNSDYIAFDEEMYETRIKIRIPSLYTDDSNRISEPLKNDTYDQYALLDLIEYFAKNIKDISERWNNERYKNYKTIHCYDTSDVFIEFQNEINGLFNDSGILFELTSEKIIERIINTSPLPEAIEPKIDLVQEDGIRELMRDAIALYKTPYPSARQDSVEKLWDALERLKTYYVGMSKKDSVEKIVHEMTGGNANFVVLFNEEFIKLTKIGNDYRIRHHETNKIDINDERYYDYLFNRCLSLIALTLEYLN